MDLTGDFVQKLASLVPQPKQLDLGDGITRILKPDGSTAHVVPADQLETAERPHRIKQTIAVRDCKSFLDYWKLYSDVDSRAFADRDKSLISAVLDYHQAAVAAVARWGSHRLVLTLRFTEEWKTWTGNNGVKMTQAEFAEFLEDNALDIIEPSSATMVECASTLQAKNEVEFEQATNLQSGQVQMRYKEEIRGSWSNGNIEIPKRFSILVPIYDGQEAVKVDARIRYRLSGSKLTFWYQLHYKERLERAAFAAIVEQVAAGGVSIFNGTL